MNITINIKAIADEARQDFRNSTGQELEDASMVDISDYVMSSVGDYVTKLKYDLEQELQDVVESLIIAGETS